MSSAELRTIRDALGLSRDDAADLLQVSPVRLRQWEDGNRDAPQGVLREMRSLWDAAERFTYLELLSHANSDNGNTDEDNSLGEPGAPIVLLRYRSHADRATDDDPHETDPAQTTDRGCNLPVTTQAMASWRAAGHLADQGRDVQIVWFNPREYHAWLGDRANTAAAHREWATTQAIPPPQEPQGN